MLQCTIKRSLLLTPMRQSSTSTTSSAKSIHHGISKIRAQSWPLVQSYLNKKVISVAITCSNTCPNIIVHVLVEGSILCWDFVFLQGSPHDISRHLIVDLLQVNEHHILVLLLLPVSLHKLPYQENSFHGDLPSMKPNWLLVTIVIPLNGSLP